MQDDVKINEFDCVVDDFQRARESTAAGAGFHLSGALASARRLARAGHVLTPAQYDAILDTLPKIQSEIEVFVPLGLARACFEMLARALREWTEPLKVRQLMRRDGAARAEAAMTLLWATARALDAAEVLGAGPQRPEGL